MNKTIVLLVFIVCNANQNYALKSGKDKIDSLLSIVINQKDDTNKIENLIILSSHFNKNDPDKGIYYAKLALELSGKLNKPKGISTSEINIGTGYLYLGKYDEAMDHYNKALVICAKTREKAKDGYDPQRYRGDL